MALDGDALGTAIRDALLAINPDSGLLNGAESTLLETYWRAVANDIIGHYEANADILPGTFQTLDITTGVELVTGIGTIT